MPDALTLAVAYVIAALGIARAVRLITSDAYPPMTALRERWTLWQLDREHWDPETQAHSAHREGIRYGWGPLLTCPFCCAPYVTAAALAAGIYADVWEPDLSSLAGWWWVAAVWASLSYVAAMIVVRDEPADE